jgi:hypothetical protein
MKGRSLPRLRRSGWLLALLALNACSNSDDEDDFKFGKADMESALHGTWVGSWTPVNGPEAPFELVIRAPDDALRDLRREEPGVRMACGNRTFSESGPGLSEQCVSETSLTVSATATVTDENPIDLEGYAITAAMILSNAYLDLTQKGAPFRLTASWDSERGFTSCNAYGADGAALASCTLDDVR